MKVLQLNVVYGVGSTGRIVADIHHMLQTNQIESYAFYGRGVEPNERNIIKMGNSRFDVYHHGLLSRLFDRHGFGSKKPTIRLTQLINEINPDIIHLHNIHGYYVNVMVLFNYLKNLNKPIVWTLHDCWPFTGHCAHFTAVKCKKWQSGCGNCPQKKSYPASILFENSASNFQLKKQLFMSIKNLTIITPSVWLAELVKLSFLSKYTIKVINNGIDTSIFKYRKSNFRQKYNLEDKFVILGVASPWTPRKGFDDFIRLSSSLSPDQYIVMVGLSKQQIEQLPKNIIGISRTHNTVELAEIYSAADIFLNLTYEDNYPTVNLESIACGTPVITYDTGGSPESIFEGCGYVVETGGISKVLDIINLKKKSKILNVPFDLIDKKRFMVEMLNLYNAVLN